MVASVALLVHKYGTGVISSAVEHFVYTEGVGSSNLSSPTTFSTVGAPPNGVLSSHPNHHAFDSGIACHE